ncbi:hypothetical protein [Salinithrix halophila]
MQLFHYHFWTDKVESMEQFYRSHGFRIALRMGKEDGEMYRYNPPLEWDDFRHRPIQFRIIEVIRGQVNVTFGAGTRDRFDHLGLLVDGKELDHILIRAQQTGMRVNKSEARTFVQTPWGIRIELQQRRDVVDDEREGVIKEAVLRLPFSTDPRMLEEWFEAEVLEETKGGITIHRDGWCLRITEGDKPRLDTVYLKSVDPFEAVDPLGVRLIGMGR